MLTRGTSRHGEVEKPLARSLSWIPASPVIQMRLLVVALSSYDISCWYDIKHKQAFSQECVPEK